MERKPEKLKDSSVYKVALQLKLGVKDGCGETSFLRDKETKVFFYIIWVIIKVEKICLEHFNICNCVAKSSEVAWGPKEYDLYIL